MPTPNWPTRNVPLCEEIDKPAPQPTCRCRECYRMREASIDPRLIAMLRDGGGIQPSRNIIRHALECYCIGHIEWASLHFEIIRALASNADEAHDRYLQVARVLPMSGGLRSISDIINPIAQRAADNLKTQSDAG